MLRTMTMRRRDFIRRVGAAAAGVAVAGCADHAAYDTRALERPELLAALGANPVRAIGARYRAMTSDENDAGSLRDAIAASRPFASRFLGAADPTVAELIRADFVHGRTVVVDGWILSATEARQCALFSLLPA